MNWREIYRRYEAGLWAVPLALFPAFMFSALFGQPSAIEPVVELFFVYTPLSLANFALNLLGPIARPLALIGAIALMMMLGGLLAIAAPATYEPKPFLLRNRLRWLSVTATALGGGVVLAKAAATPISALAALLTGLFFVPVLLWTRTWHRTTPSHTGRRKVLHSLLGTPLVAFSLLTLSTYELWSSMAVQVFSLGNHVRQLFPFVAPKPRKPNFPVNGIEPEVTPVAQFYVNSKNITDPLQLAENWELHINGLVRNPTILTYSQLLRLPRTDLYATMRCVDNSIDGHLMSTALWSGVRITELLDLVQPLPEATTLVCHAADQFDEPLALAELSQDAAMLVRLQKCEMVASIRVDSAASPGILGTHRLDGAEDPSGGAHRHCASLGCNTRTGRRNSIWGARWRFRCTGTRGLRPLDSGRIECSSARNEEANLPPLLDSLIAQDYPLYEVIVIDDSSTDGTAALVRSYEKQGVRLIQNDAPLPGWTGKNAACWRGASESMHPWLLFVDADTMLAPVALRSSIAFALEQHAGAISLLARQRCETFWERLLLPFAYQQYFVGVNVQRIHSPRGPALANGQYFLIHREAYLQAGGHAANASSLIDDVALATRLKRLGTIPQVCRGEMLVSVRMYTNLREIIAGFGKNSYLFLRQSPSTGIETAISTSLAASVGKLFWDAWHRRSRRMLIVAIGAYAAQAFSARSWSRRFGVSTFYALLMPFSALTFLGIALNSMLRVLTGRPLPWKGRSYQSPHTIAVPAPIARKWLIEMGRAILTNTPRSIIEDSALSVRVLPKTPCVTGVEHIPAEGSFVLVANHYQRLNLWIGWSGTLLIDAVASKRDIIIHVVTTDRARIGRITFPGTRWIIERVAAVWDLVLVTPPAVAHGKTDGQRYTLLRLLRLLKRQDGRDVCLVLMPEGDEGGTAGLIDALPGSGRALAALSARHLPIVPAGVWDEDGRLYANFGEPFSLQIPSTEKTREAVDTLARRTVMEHIAALLPPALRGKNGRQIDGTLE